MISFFVAGEPAPKGSTRSFYTGGKVITTNANRRTKDWEMRIATEAQKASEENNWALTPNAVTIRMLFWLPRPKSLPKKVFHDIKKPDLDKLIRAVLDGITDILIADDSQVVGIDAEKKYAPLVDLPPPIRPGVLIELEELP